MKSLKDISLPITEKEYREDGNLHYSTLATYERGGFNSLATLYERKESPSLLFGSLVDTLITGTKEEFDSLYLVADFPECPDSVILVVKSLFTNYSSVYSKITDIPNSIVIDFTEQLKYQLNWKPETRAKVIKEKGYEYYNLLFLAQSKTIVSSTDYDDALKAVAALKESVATKFLFCNNNPFDNIERLYQLKFKHTFNGVTYSCMADELIVLHDKKKVIPIDLKTSYKPEYDFYKSFLEWSYAIQGRLYYRIIRAAMNEDDYFKDFELENYHFVVVNRTTLNPLVWKFEDTKKEGDLIYGKDNQIILRDPFIIGAELKEYLDTTPSVPKGINIDKPNSLTEWINRI